ncbi:MAG: SURF1 family protein [Qipengyuania sp.]|jgi:surfeit locus 1 family protein|nr:SURF1 family protein [Qipengyuania sp.]
MTRRLPVFATLVVAAAAATMIALGFWQLGRARERDRLHERLIERLDLPEAEYPYRTPADEDFLFRRVTAQCERVASWQTRAGVRADGPTGWRRIASCRSPLGTTFLADLGIAARPAGEVAWAGGVVRGRAIREPDNRGAFERLFGPAPPRRLMIVAESAAPGLAPSKQPDPADESNSSWSYMVQWFLFAATALAIYALALRSRWRAR